MKTFVILIFLIAGTSSYAQSNGKTVSSISDSTNINQEYAQFFKDYEKEMQTWPQERIDHFNKTFVYTRGHFTIPEENIVPYAPKN